MSNENENAAQVKPTRKGLTRRSFIKLSALAGALVAGSRIIGTRVFGSVPAPAKIQGVASEKWIATSCLNCSTRCATRVRVVNGRAVKVIGNPLDEVSEGKNCARGQMGLQVLYNPDRITGPMKRTNPAKGRDIDPKWAPVTWEQALNEVNDLMKKLRSQLSPHQLLLLQGLNTSSDEEIIRHFADAYGTPNLINEDGLNNEAVKAGGWMADGHYNQSAYDLPRTNYILAFGASILESEKPLARNLRMWGKIRRERPNRAKVVVIDPRYSMTAAKADMWIPINPGTDAALALGIANVLISENLYDAKFVQDWTAGFDEYKSLALGSYSPEKVAEITGVAAEVIRQIAREFAAARPAIAWRGRGATNWPNGSYASYAIYCLNALAGSIDVPGGVTYQVDPPYKPFSTLAEDDVARDGKAKPRIDLSQTGDFPAARMVSNRAADSIIEGKPYSIEMAVSVNCNFPMSAPGAGRWDEALKKIPYYVFVGSFANEMSPYADILLPCDTFMEAWAYDHSPPGSGFAEVKIKQPVVERLHNTKSIAEILGGVVDSAESLVKFSTGDLLPWDKFRQDGVWVGPAYQYYKYDRIFLTPSKKFEFVSGNLDAQLKKTGKPASSRTELLPHYEAPAFLGDNSYTLTLAPYHTASNVENGGQNYPWAQEFFLVEHGAGWTNFAEINRHTAGELGVRDGDMVWVESPYGKIKARAKVFEGVHPKVVCIAAGQGYSFGRFARGIGVNPNEIIGVDYDRLSGQSAFFNTRVKVYRA